MTEEINEEIARYIADSAILRDKHETMKKKWLDLSTYDLFERIRILEEVSNLVVTWKSLYMEDKRWLEAIKGNRRIELKSETTADGKKKHTESTADAVICNEFKEEDELLWKLKTSYELLWNIANTIPEYVNLVKMNMKALNPLQWIPWE